MLQKRVEAKRCHEGYAEYACDLCGSTQTVEMPHVRKYTNGQLIHICKICGFVYVNKRRPYDKVADVWSKELFGKAYTSKTPLMLARHTYVAEFIDQSIGLKEKALCDIGAGEGQFLKIVMDNYGSKVFGIEPSKANCVRMDRLEIKNFTGTLEDYLKSPSRKERRADIATMMWTLENATSCRDLLMGSRDIIKDGGYLVIATGSRILVPFAKPLHLYLSPNPVDTHPSRFSLNTLSSFLLTSGFKVTHVNPYLNDSLVMCVIAKKAAMPKKPRIKGDDFRKIRNFFDRWHKETGHYK